MSVTHSPTLDADQIQPTHPPLVYATFLRRLAAWLIDLVILAVIGFVIGIITSLLLPWRIDNTAGYLIMLIYGSNQSPGGR